MSRRSRQRSPQRAGGDIVFGLHAVTGLLERAPERVLSLMVAAGRQGRRMAALRARAEAGDIAIEPVRDETLEALCSGGAHQGVAARVRPRPSLDERGLERLLAGLDRPPLLLLLDGVQDPHNLGACLRTADAAGVDAVIAPRHRAVGVTSAARKTASGAAETIPFVQVTNLARSLRWLAEHGVWRIGASAEAGKSLFDCDLAGPLALVLGGEGSGLRRLTREHCDELAALPLRGTVASLNVSVAAGVCLYEALRQRRRAPAPPP